MGFEKVMGKIAEFSAPPSPSPPPFEGGGLGTQCIGITGPPGAGKSTLTDHLIRAIRKEGLKVGVVAIDPSSPFSGGAVLGDRVRMQGHAGDKEVFIRSLGSRGSHGGLSRATRDIVRVMSAFGFERLIVETVGVGQTELDIMGLADTTVVVLVPEAGDTIQTMKAGLTEIADIFVVNKADRPGADEIIRGLHALVETSPTNGWKIPVIKMEAVRGIGIEELYEKIKEHNSFTRARRERDKEKKEMRKMELYEITLDLIGRRLKDKFRSSKKISSIIEKAVSGEENPYIAAEKIVDTIDL